MKAGVVSGLPRETACFQSIPEPDRQFATFAGVGPVKAADGAHRLVDQGAEALMSFGVAGGLSDVAAAGHVVLATVVVDGQAHLPTDDAWRARIRDAIDETWPVIEAPLCGIDKMVPSPADKQALHAATGAVAVDMESHAVARVAAERGVPFATVRAISDPWNRNVPKWILRCLTPEGGVRTGALAWQAARRPWAWGNVIALARDSGKSFDGLRRVAFRIGPGLGL